jgi:hypothetical protein
MHLSFSSDAVSAMVGMMKRVSRHTRGIYQYRIDTEDLAAALLDMGRGAAVRH